MKIRLKLVSALLAMTTLFTSAAVAEEAENNHEMVSGAVKNLLLTLGIMSEADISNTGYVTRAYAAKAVINMIGHTDIGTASGTMFVDVPANQKYAAEIETAACNNLVYGVGDGLYKPNDEISDENMAVILLRYAGYDKFDDISTKSKLLKKVNTADNLSYADLANMIYNVLNLNVSYIKSINKSGTTYAIDGDKTILNENFGIYKAEGVVIDDGTTAFFTYSDVRKDEVVIASKIGNIVMKIGDTDLNKMIGRNVTVYYEADNSLDKYVCISYDVSDTGNRIEEISLFDIDYASSDATKIKYIRGESTGRLKLSSVAAVIYNGTFYNSPGFTVSLLSGMEGTLTAIDNDSDNVFDVLVIEAYDVYVIKNVLLNDKLVIKDDGSGIAGAISLDEEKYDIFGIYNYDGTYGNIEDLEAGIVLSVATNNATSDKKTMRIVVSDNTVTGTVTSVDTDDYGKQFIELDSEDRYYLLSSFTGSVTVGNKAVIALSAYNNAAGLSTETKFKNPVGIITKFILDRKDSTVVIRMITANNKHEEFKIDKKIKIDGKTAKDIQEIYSLLQTAATNSKIVFTDGTSSYAVEDGVFPARYKLRDNGELAELDTPYRNTAYEDLDTFLPYDSGHYFYEHNVMGAKFALKDSAQAFIINANPSSGIIKSEWVEDSQYVSMSTVSSAVSRGTYFECSYKLKSGGIFADFIILFNPWGAKASNSDLFMVEKVNQVYDPVSGETTYEVEGIEGNVERRYKVSDLYKSGFETITSAGTLPERGTVLRLALDEYGNVVNAKMQIELNLNSVSTSSKIMTENINNGETSLSTLKEYAKSAYIFYGYAKERDGNFVNVAYKPPVSTITGGMDSSGLYDKDKIGTLPEVMASIPSSASIIVYDIDKNEIYSGSYDEIYDYKSCGNKCSFVALFFSSAKVTSGIVYNYTDLVKP